MAKTLAPYDPAPTNDTSYVNKLYHFTWAKRGKKTRIVLHKGPADKCRRVHLFQDGDRA